MQAREIPIHMCTAEDYNKFFPVNDRSKDQLETIKTTFDENGVGIPYPQHDVHIHQVK